MKNSPSQLFSFLICLLLANGLAGQATNLQRAVLSVERIWDRAGHSAFTDLIYFHNKYYCTFREGTGHIPGSNGSIRVIASEDGQNWTSVAHLMEANVDLRDPKLSAAPNGSLMLSMEAAYYEGRKVLKREPRVAFSDKKGRLFSAPRRVELPGDLVSADDWLWRVSWQHGVGYVALYQVKTGDWEVHLLKTMDGIRYDRITTFELTGKPSETTLRFGPDQQMVAVVRRDSSDFLGMVGTSLPPYDSWNWNRMEARLGGPNLIQLPGGRWLCATRDYSQKESKTALAFIDPSGRYTKVLVLPSGGDTSYPGLVLRNGILYVSYYSGHEGKTSIYLAKISVAELLTLPPLID